MRALLALGGAVAVLGAVLLIWGVRQQVAWSDCRIHCVGGNPWPVTALGVMLLLGGGFGAAWTAASGHANRVLGPAGHEQDEREPLRRAARTVLARLLRRLRRGIS